MPAGRPDVLSHGETDVVQTGELMRFTISANMAGIPALSIPVGHSSAGAPPMPCMLQMQIQASASALLHDELATFRHLMTSRCADLLSNIVAQNAWMPCRREHHARMGGSEMHVFVQGCRSGCS